MPNRFRTGAFGDREWLSAGDDPPPAWWISWAPSLGMFIARTSKGRTHPKFVVGVLLIRSGSASLVRRLRGAAINLQLTGDRP